MGSANFTLAGKVRVVPNSDYSVSVSIGSHENSLKEVRLSILHESSQRIAAQVGNLNHAGERAVNKQRCLNDVFNFGPKRSVLMEIPH